MKNGGLLLDIKIDIIRVYFFISKNSVATSLVQFLIYLIEYT